MMNPLDIHRWSPRRSLRGLTIFWAPKRAKKRLENPSPVILPGTWRVASGNRISKWSNCWSISCLKDKPLLFLCWVIDMSLNRSKTRSIFWGGVQKCSKAGGHGSQESPGSFVSKFEELELTSIFQYLDVYTLINYKERIFCSSELASVLPKINTLGCSNPIKDSPWNLEFSGTLFTPNIQNLSNGAMFGPWPKGLEIPKKQMKLSISNMFHL